MSSERNLFAEQKCLPADLARSFVLFFPVSSVKKKENEKETLFVLIFARTKFRAKKSIRAQNLVQNLR